MKEASADDIREEIDTYLKYARILYEKMQEEQVSSVDHVIDGAKSLDEIINEITEIVLSCWISTDLKDIFQNVIVVSETNLRYVIWFYDFYSIDQQKVVVEYKNTEKYFNLTMIIPDDLKGSLTIIEEIEAELNDNKYDQN